jgi:chromosome segregation ATPase
MNPRVLFLAGLFPLISMISAAQTDKKATELRNLEAGIANAKARVVMNEKKMAAADSLINTGKKMFHESKTDARSVDSDSRKLEKDYAAKYKALRKLASSRDKAEANKARTDLRALDTSHKASNRALEIRLKDAIKKQTAGITSIEKGKTAKKNTRDALKVSIDALRTAQAKYDATAKTTR